MIKVFYNRLTKCPFTENFLNQIVTTAAREEKKIRGTVEINVVDGREIKKINKIYRGQNKITDVLSFAWGEDNIIATDSLGQIYLCYPRIAVQAKEYHVSARQEFARMLVHGLLHLVGYDHQAPAAEKTMFALQEKIVKMIEK